jgi:hypothetical protein
VNQHDSTRRLWRAILVDQAHQRGDIDRPAPPVDVELDAEQLEPSLG